MRSSLEVHRIWTEKEWTMVKFMRDLNDLDLDDEKVM